jgi:hypothetical protein
MSSDINAIEAAIYDKQVQLKESQLPDIREQALKDLEGLHAAKTRLINIADNIQFTTAESLFLEELLGKNIDRDDLSEELEDNGQYNMAFRLYKRIKAHNERELGE